MPTGGGRRAAAAEFQSRPPRRARWQRALPHSWAVEKQTNKKNIK